MSEKLPPGHSASDHKDKVGEAMHKFKRGQLHSGTGKKGQRRGKVTSRAQALAIALGYDEDTAEFYSEFLDYVSSEKAAEDADEGPFGDIDSKPGVQKPNRRQKQEPQGMAQNFPTMPNQTDNPYAEGPLIKAKKGKCPRGTKLTGAGFCRNPDPGHRQYITLDRKGQSCPPGAKSAGAGFCRVDFSEDNPLEGQCNQEEKKKRQTKQRSPEQREADRQRGQDMKGQDNVPSSVRQEAAAKAAKTRAKCKKTTGATQANTQNNAVVNNYAESLDFTRCERPDGTFYGTRGQCRKGNEVGAREIAAARPKTRRGQQALAQATPEQLKKLAASPKVNPAQKAVLEQEIKKKAEAPAEEKGYKPRDREERQGLRGLKDRLLSSQRAKGLEGIAPSEKEILKARDDYKQILSDRISRAPDKKTADLLKQKIERAEKNADLEVSRLGTNRKFAQDLKSNLPPKVNASFDPDDGSIILRQKVGKNTIETTFNSGEGFNYRVNGKYDTGTVKDRKEQLRIAMAVRSQYDAVVRSLPEGSVIKTSAYDKDGGGAARQKAYEKIGFSKPDDKGEMFARKKGDSMIPSSLQQQEAAFQNPDTLWFVESAQAKEQDEIWRTIIFGG